MTGSVVIGDSLTYTTVNPIGSSASPIVNFLLQAADEARPVIRSTGGASEWVLTGGGDAVLVLDGLLITGTDIVLRGSFSSVTITGCTTDPGATASSPAPAGESPLAAAVDGQPLAPVTIFVEADPSQPSGSGGAIANLTVSNSILGPIRTRFGGAVQSIDVSDSIIQAVPTSNVAQYSASDVYDPVLLAEGLTSSDPLAQNLLTKMQVSSPSIASDLHDLASEPLTSAEGALPASLVTGLNALVGDADLVDSTTVSLFQTAVALGPSNAALFATVAQDVASGQPSSLDSADQATLNRALVDGTFPVALGLSTLALSSASVSLSQVTVIGPVYAHELTLSNSIVTGLAVVDDLQQGCVRFSAIVPGSQVPRQYESVLVPEGAQLFTSEDFAQPGYCQLLDSADDLVLAASEETSVIQGADNGSEMGAFNAELNPVKQEALLIKYAEYMPLGLTPVIVHVT
jgi:hypothetical protein